ncbi:MAG: four helix bundle protein [Acidobacteria bacterium]|nr:four helix bundle protein [Acidobacteriota bacterium]
MPENQRQETRSFEDLRIFKEARMLANRICTLTRTEIFSRDYALSDQMRRSAISILSNIAEGYERETTAEFARFLFIAKGSCGELRAQVMLAHDQKFV